MTGILRFRRILLHPCSTCFGRFFKFCFIPFAETLRPKLLRQLFDLLRHLAMVL